MKENLSENHEICTKNVQISNISTGFIEIPANISLNLYVQGCKMRCEGCQNPDLQPFEGGTTISVGDLPTIIAGRSLPTWICWLGGDAVYQPDGFLAFNKFFKANNYKICLYTGKTFEEIESLLEDVDLVIDGAWEGIKVDEEGTNQKVYLKCNNEWKEVPFNELKNMLGE
jgi:anaerobic ribonucleoside-triphosphate reductase activating protein